MHRAWVTGHKEGSGAQPSVDKIASLFAPSLLACCRVSVHFFALFCAILGPIFGSFLVPKMRPRFCHFNCKCINGLKSGPNFGSNFGYHFWAPKSVTFLLPGGCPGQNFWSHIWVPWACCEVLAYLQQAKMASSHAAHAHAAPMLV